MKVVRFRISYMILITQHLKSNVNKLKTSKKVHSSFFFSPKETVRPQNAIRQLLKIRKEQDGGDR